VTLGYYLNEGAVRLGVVQYSFVFRFLVGTRSEQQRRRNDAMMLCQIMIG